jgi:hypothetical protein
VQPRALATTRKKFRIGFTSANCSLSADLPALGSPNSALGTHLLEASQRAWRLACKALETFLRAALKAKSSLEWTEYSAIFAVDAWPIFGSVQILRHGKLSLNLQLRPDAIRSSLRAGAQT